MSIFFIAGVYGVGKSTLCLHLSEKLKIPSFSAGDLISSINGEQYGANKTVSDKTNNQNILLVEINKRLQCHPRILLAGHFCIFDCRNQVDKLPESIYSNLSIKRILLLEASTDEILENLSIRDHRSYSFKQIVELQEAECIMAKKMSSQLGCELFIHKMLFDETDIEKCLSYFKGDW